LKQSKRQARDRNRQARGKSRGAGQPATGTLCPSCKTAVRPDARFCHHCGARLSEHPAPKSWNAPTVVLYSIIALGVVVAAAGAIFMTGETPGTMPAPTAPAALSAGSGQPADISTMTPREAADRLFNRVVMASEQGNIEEALQFAPMAIQAYEGVPRLDADAHYHMGLIYEVASDFDNVRNQVAIIKQYAPDHLLGLILEHGVAEKSGDPFGAARVAAAFAAAYDAEIRADRPEYEAHRKTIENFRTTYTDR
jgi:hypothetical protein